MSTPPDFETLANQNRTRLYSLALRLTANPDDAQDLVQDTLLRAFRAFASYDTSCPFRPWASRIMIRLNMDRGRKESAKRKHANGPVLSLNEPLGDSEDLFLDAPDVEADPARQMQRHTLDSRAEHALAFLPESWAQAIRLCDGEERSYEDIAETMGCTLGTVRSRIHRARQFLREAAQLPAESV